MPETQIKIGRIREASGDFVKRQKEGGEFSKKNCERKQTEIKGVAKDLRIRYKSILSLKRYGLFRRWRSLRTSRRFRGNKERTQDEIENATQGRKEAIAKIQKNGKKRD